MCFHVIVSFVTLYGFQDCWLALVSKLVTNYTGIPLSCGEYKYLIPRLAFVT